LRDAVMHRLETEAGVDLEHMRLADVAGVTARVLQHVSAYPLDARPPLDPTLAETNRRRHAALLAAVAERTPRWSASDRTVVAAMLDVLWSLAPYERLVNDWELGRDETIRAITWVIRLIEDAVAGGHRPPSA
jgi:hypothetical protein